MTETRESVGAFSVLDDRVLEKNFITGPVSAAAADARVRKFATQDCSPWPS